MAARAWSFQISTEPSYGGNQGYADDVERVYQYDSKVQYHAQVERGDTAVLLVDGEAIGVATITTIESEAGTKTLQRCPNCMRTTIRRRRYQSPAFKCQRCDTEFEHPKDDEIDVTIFRAILSDLEPLSGISAAQIREVAKNRGLTAIKPLENAPLRGLIAHQAPRAGARLS